MATKKITGTAGKFDSDSNASQTWIETSAAGANTYNIQDATAKASLVLRGATGDVVNIEGASSEFAVKAVGRVVTLKSETQTIILTLVNAATKAGAQSVKLNFLDGSIDLVKTANVAGLKLGGVAPSNKILGPINGTVNEADNTAINEFDDSGSNDLQPSYSVAASPTTVDEGKTVNFTLTTTNVAEGRTFNYSLSGVSEDDIVGGSLTGTATVDSLGIAIIPVTLVADSKTEGAENLQITIAGKTASVSVADTSLAPEEGARYTLKADASTVTEGQSLTFTVTRTGDLSAAKELVFGGAGQGSAPANVANDFTPGSDTVTFAAGSDKATFSIAATADTATEGLEGLKVTLYDGGSEVENTGVLIKDDPNVGQTFTLTTGVDNFTGNAGNDTFIATIDGTTTANATLTGLDAINGGAGTADTLTISNISSAVDDKTDLSVATITNIETINIKAVGGITKTNNSYIAGTDNVDFSTISGLTTVNATKSVEALIKAAATTDVNVSGASGLISVIGGKNVSVTDATAAKAITVGNGAAAGDAAGTITVTDTNNTGAANLITVEGGTAVTVTTTADKATSGAIVVGSAANGMASGAVVITQNTTSNGTAATAGNVTVVGGSTVDITANMTNTAVKAGSANAITAAAFNVTAGNSTTEVTITQNATATDYANTAAAGSAEVSTVTFSALASGEKAVISAGALTGAGTDLTFTASKALTAAEVAAAFASLTAADTQVSGGKTANGTFSGALDAGWTSGAASGANVTFTNTAVGNQTSEITVSAKLADGTTNTANVAEFKIASKTDGVAATASNAVDVTADYGTVVINDVATATIKTITLDGYDTATLGGTTSLGALTTLTLSNSSGANSLDNGAGTALTLNLNKITGTTTLDTGSASVTDLTINTSGTASSTALTAAALKNLTVAAAVDLTITPTSIAALETLTVTGAGAVSVGDISAATTTITAGSATGAITATVDGTKATVTTGSGADSITVDTATQTKAITLGAGDDTLTYSTAILTLPTGATAGGDGTDTVVVTTASAEALDANTGFKTAMVGFEHLTISDATAATIDAEALGFNYVTYAGAATGTLDKVAAASTTVFEAATNNATITLKTATGSTDVANVVLNNKSANLAVYTIDLTGAALALGQTLSVGGVVLRTAAGAENATAIATAIGGTTIVISGVTYDINAAVSSAVTLTAQTSVATTATTLAITSTGTAPTDATADLTSAADVAFGTVTIANVETVNLNSNDTTTSVVSAVDNNTVTLVLDKATTLNVTGSSDVDLTTTAALLTTVDASAMTGVFKYTAGVASSTVTGGSGADQLTANANGATIKGGAGNDQITINDNIDLLKIDGGTGADTFVIGTSASSNKSNYAVFSNVDSGDVFDFTATAFKSAAVVLATGATQSTQAFLDQAVTDLAAGGIGWFQYNGNTFIAADIGGDSTTAFVDGTDLVVMITGLVDLTTASFHTGNGTLEIA